MMTSNRPNRHIVPLGGRLGNQLFKVAFVLARSLETGRPWAVTGAKDVESVRGLEAWVGPLPWADPAEVLSLQGRPGVLGKLYRTGQALLPAKRRRWVEQNSSRFTPWSLNVEGPTFWSGYWQSYRYWSGQETGLRQALSYRPALGAALMPWVDKALFSDSVAVHIRRTDYLTSQGFAALESSYYETALKRLNPTGLVLVFSDDPLWCREQLKWPVPFEVVEGGLPEEDLYLMSLCHHHIIANSTFSWWGAWLGERQGGRVFAPATWFPTYGKVPPLSDIYPPTWELIPLEKLS